MASPFCWSFCYYYYVFFFFKNMFPLFSSKLPHSDRVLHIHYISGRDKIKNLCHLHDRPEKPASHLNIAKNWVIGSISDRRMGLLIYVKGNWIQVVLSLADVQHYFCQLVVKLKRDIFLRIETWNNNILQHQLIMLSHEMDDLLMWKDANDTEFWVFVGSGGEAEVLLNNVPLYVKRTEAWRSLLKKKVKKHPKPVS